MNNIKDLRNHRNPYSIRATIRLWKRDYWGRCYLALLFCQNLVCAIFVFLESSKFEEQEDVIKYISVSKYLSPPLTKIGIVHMYTDHNSVITSIFITKNAPQNDIVPVPFPAPRKMGHQLFFTTQMNFCCGAFKLQRLAD